MDKVLLQNSLSALDKWAIVFGVFVAIGVVGESIVGYLHWRRSGQLQAILESESREQQQVISEANARALEAQVALEQLKSPRDLTLEQQQRITSKMASFKGLKAILGAVPPSEKNTTFLSQILHVLKDADIDAFVNLVGVEAEVSPSGISNRGKVRTDGFPSGISIYYVTGNERGEACAKALAEALNEEKVVARAVGDWRETWVASQLGREDRTRNDKPFEPIWVVVGDKPY